jgi:transcriptional regulator with XRE-family HTH domain
MKDETLVKFGKNVRALRLKRKLTQERLSEMAECHPTYIGLVELGKSSVAVKKILKISKALNCKVSQLFKGLE